MLEDFVRQHKEYSWEVRDGVVHVFSKPGYRDPIVEDLLRVEIGAFSIGKNTVVWGVETKLRETPEFKALFDAYGLSSQGWIFSEFSFPQLGRNYTLDVCNLSVRSILNRIVKESPTAKFWSIGRDSADHTLGISFSANHEGTPKNWRPIRLDQAVPAFDEL